MCPYRLFCVVKSLSNMLLVEISPRQLAVRTVYNLIVTHCTISYKLISHDLLRELHPCWPAGTPPALSHHLRGSQHHQYILSYLVLKLQNVQEVAPNQTFFHPYIQCCGMFLGESLCIIVYLFRKCSQQ